MGGLAHLFEAEGFATVVVGFVREHFVSIAPPRALWVNFPMGRPFGNPNDPGFQRNVIRAALALLEDAAGPVLKDYPVSIPVHTGRMSYGLPHDVVSNPEDWADLDALLATVQAEIEQWRPDYEKAVALHGRTTVGASGLSAEELVPFIISYLRDQSVASPRKDVQTIQMVKLACEDLWAYYTEAASSASGITDFESLNDLFWTQTSAARAILALEALSERSDDKILRELNDWFMIVPRYWS